MKEESLDLKIENSISGHGYEWPFPKTLLKYPSPPPLQDQSKIPTQPFADTMTRRVK